MEKVWVRRFAALCLVLSVMTVGCGRDTGGGVNTDEAAASGTLAGKAGGTKEQKADGDSHTSEMEVRLLPENELLEAGKPEEVNLADLLQRSAAGAMVRLESDAAVGSGVIWSEDGERLTVVSAGHVLAGKESVRIVFADGFQVESGEIFCPEAADLGFVTVALNQIPEEHLACYCRAAVDQEAFDGLAAGDIIIVTGSRDGIAANAYEGELLDPWIYMEDFQQYMMWGKTYVKAGMSGGGVFDARGRLIGILCGADGENGVAILPISIIRTEFELYAAD